MILWRWQVFPCCRTGFPNSPSRNLYEHLRVEILSSSPLSLFVFHSLLDNTREAEAEAAATCSTDKPSRKTSAHCKLTNVSPFHLCLAHVWTNGPTNGLRGGCLLWVTVRASGCPWNSDTCGNAANGGHLQILRWARCVCVDGGGAQYERP